MRTLVLMADSSAVKLVQAQAETAYCYRTNHVMRTLVPMAAESLEQVKPVQEQAETAYCYLRITKCVHWSWR